MSNWTRMCCWLAAAAGATSVILGAAAPAAVAHEVRLDDPPARAWARLLGGSGLDSGFGAAAAAADGGVFVTGRTDSERLGDQISAGGSDMVLARFAPNGEVRWVRLLGGGARDTGFGVAAAPDGGVVMVGYTTSASFGGLAATGTPDVVVARYDANGRRLWVRLLATKGVELATSVAFDGDGSIVVVGSIDSRPLIGRDRQPAADGGSDDIHSLFAVDARIGPPRSFGFVARYSPEGERLLFRRYGGPSAQTIARDVGIGPDGAIYVAGDTYEPELDGQTNSGAVDAMLAKFDAEGRHQWTRLYGFKSEDDARGVAVDDAGFIYIAGSVENWGRLCTVHGCTRVRLNPDMLLAKYDPEGRRVWTRVLRGLQWDFLQDVAIGPGNRVYVMGWTNSAALEHQPTSVDGNGDRAITVGAYDTSGNGKWLFFAAEGNGFAVTVSDRGDLYAVGWAKGTFLGQKSAGSGDIAVIKFSAHALHQAGAG